LEDNWYDYWQVKLNPEFHVVKGINYKSGVVATMLIDVSESKTKWNGDSAAAKGDTQNKTESMPKKSDSKSASDSVPPTSAAPAEPECDDSVDSIDTTTVGSAAGAGAAESSSKVSALPGKKAEPAFKKGFLNSKSSSKSAVVEASKPGSKQESDGLILPGNVQAPGGAGKIVEVSDYAPGTSSSARTDSTATVAACEIVQPKFSLVERGNLGMGDFEAMRANTVASNRPAELVFKVELPSISSAAAVDLDVSEKEISLSGKGLSSLRVALPYPVFDKKGLAKFDKKTKILTVTLPVKPHDNKSVLGSRETAPPVVDITQDSTSDAMAAVSEGSLAKPVSEVKEPSKSLDKKKVTHTRWVDSSSEDTNSKALKEEVQQKAKAALESNKKTAAAVNAPDAAIAPKSSRVERDSRNEKMESPDQAFIPSPHFVGSKTGYIFTTKDKGTGYYVDVNPFVAIRIQKPTNEPAIVAAAAAAAATGISSFPFECKQNLQSISMLVKVPGILMDSVQVQYDPKAVRISFRTESGSTHSMSIGMKEPIDPTQCRHDVSQKNMVIILSKLEPGIWTATQSSVDDALKQLSSETRDVVTSYIVLGSLDLKTSAPRETASVDDEQIKRNAAAGSAVNVDKLKESLKSLEFQSTAALFELD
jgi:HSP20 family molecular chaperone IbpA